MDQQCLIYEVRRVSESAQKNERPNAEGNTGTLSFLNVFYHYSSFFVLNLILIFPEVR